MCLHHVCLVCWLSFPRKNMASQPPQSLRVRESAVLGYSHSAVWDLIRKLDFSALTPDSVRTCVVEQGPAARVGSLRVATHNDGSMWSYRVTELSDVSRSIGYELYHMQGATAGSGGAPYSSAHTTISVLPVSCGSASGGCFVTWTTDFSSDASVAVTTTTRKTTRAAFNAMRAKLGASRFADNVAEFSVGSLPGACRHVLMDDAFPVQQCVDDFLARGGKLMVIDDAVKPGKFLIAPSDHLFPVCSSGQNRSQVMRELLLQRTSGTKFSGHVALAHAAIAGVDPYVDDAMSATVATVDIDATMPAFAEEFGHPRDPRIGEAEFPFGGFYEAGDPFLLSAKVCTRL